MEKSELIDLYRSYSESFHEYAKIIWQFPTAIVTLNVLALGQAGQKDTVLAVLVFINYAFLFFVYPRHVANQKSLRDQLRKLEGLIYAENTELLPKFRKPFLTSTFAVQFTLFVANSLLLFYITNQIFDFGQVTSIFGRFF